MRNHVSHITGAVVLAAAAIACSGRTHSVDNDRRDQSGGNRGTSQKILVQGCLQEAPGTNAYVLKEVIEPPPAAQPQGQEQVEHGPTFEPGSWVRLIGGTQNLKGFVGQRVSVTGEVTDSGANTLGTSGRLLPEKEPQTRDGKFKQSSKDASTNPDRAVGPTTAAPEGGDANGNAPRMAVENISKIEGSCGTRP